MFFKTHKRAELKVPYETAPGEKLWSFVELEFSLPVYVMRTEIEAEGVTLGGEVLALNVLELIKFAEGRDHSHRLLAVDLLFNAPGLERRSFHRLNEVWRAPANGALRFIVDDGAALDLDVSGQGFDASTLQLIFQAPALHSSSHG
ncbi:hypothetical protein ACNQFN_22655 (plasmid) [Thauera butanivorans]|uniref:hypothetical protein n=1 Tax=Thauera butanivorans TaxID=86174 RepID=UPI003AB2F55F